MKCIAGQPFGLCFPQPIAGEAAALLTAGALLSAPVPAAAGRDSMQLCPASEPLGFPVARQWRPSPAQYARSAAPSGLVIRPREGIDLLTAVRYALTHEPHLPDGRLVVDVRHWQRPFEAAPFRASLQSIADEFNVRICFRFRPASGQEPVIEISSRLLSLQDKPGQRMCAAGADRRKDSTSHPLGTYLPGQGVSEGAARWAAGRAKFTAGGARRGDILVMTVTTPETDWNAMDKAAGFVTTQGGPLSHAGITAREMGKHAVILDNASIRKNVSGEWEMVVAQRGAETLVREGDILRVMGAAEGGGIFVIRAGEWTRLGAGGQMRFCLEELLSGAGGHDEVRALANMLLGSGRVAIKNARQQAARLQDGAARAAREMLANPNFAVGFKRKKMEEFLSAILRLEPFLSPKRVRAAREEFGAARDGLLAEEAKEAGGEQMKLEDQARAILSLESDAGQLPALRRLLRGLNAKTDLHAEVKMRAALLEEQRLAAIERGGGTIFRLDDVTEDHISLVGGKCARLGEIARIGDFPVQIRVPCGAGLSRKEFEAFLLESGIFEKFYAMRDRIDEALEEVFDSDEEKFRAVDAACRRMQKLIREARVSPDFAARVRDALPESGAPLAIRSSGIAEDDEGGAYAGMARTHLNVIEFNDIELYALIQDVWASFWSAEGVFYRCEKFGISGADCDAAVIVQEMIDADVSGVLFSKDFGGGDNAVIQACYGLGTGAVSDRVESDIFRAGADGAIRADIARKTKMIVSRSAGKDDIGKGDSGTTEEAVPEEIGSLPCLREADVLNLARIGRRLRDYFGFEVDVEFSIAGGVVHILQVRPVTDSSRLPAAQGAGRATERALALLQRAETPMLYFVCQGNRHRSAAMHMLMDGALQREGLHERVVVNSGGTYAGDEPDHEIVDIAISAGVPAWIVDEFEPRAVVPDDADSMDEDDEPAINGATLIITADRDIKEWVTKMFPRLKDRIFAFNELCRHAFPNAGPDIEDPVTRDMKQRVFDGIARGIEEDLLPLVKEAFAFEELSKRIAETNSGDEKPAKKSVPLLPDGAVPTFAQTRADLADRMPDEWNRLREAMDEFDWGEGERGELTEAVGHMERVIIDRDDFLRGFSLLPDALECLNDTGWETPVQASVLKFVIYAFGAQIYAVLEDVELALLAKIDEVMDTKSLTASTKRAVVEHLKMVSVPREVRKTAEVFARRLRFHGLALLRKHFGVVPPLTDKTEARARLDELIADQNFDAADALYEMRRDLGDVEADLADLGGKERARRSRRAPRKLDTERKALFDEISEFYLIEALKMELAEAEKTRLSPAARDASAGLKEAFEQRETQMFNWIREYILYAVSGELEHQEDTRGEFHPAGHSDLFLSGQPSPDADIETFMKLATEEEIRLYLERARQIFSPEEWPVKRGGEFEIGGKVWSTIADLGYKMWKPGVADPRLLDLAFRLKHNNNLAFDKRPDLVFIGEEDALLLDLRMISPHFDHLYGIVRARLGDGARERLDGWLGTIRSLRF